MRLMTLKQYMKMSKPALIRKITMTLRAMPKVKLARICYNFTKSKLPRLRTTNPKRLTLKEIQKERKRFDERMAPFFKAPRLEPKRKTKRKKMTLAEKTKFLARINKGRIKAGLKPIRAKR